MNPINKKIVIWGCLPFYDTYSYIHYGFYKALKYMGYDVIWLDDQPVNSTDEFENCIFITEHNNIKHLPILESATYFVHNLNEHGFYDQNIIDHPKIYNFLVYAEHYNWDNAIELPNNLWYSPQTKTLCILWATDLLPYEIDELEPSVHNESDENIYFVGTKQGINIDIFENICQRNDKNFLHVGGLNGIPQDASSRFFNAENTINTVRNSYISFDIRERAADRVGYVPCRVLKNISYGKWTGSNTPKISRFLEDNVTVDEDLFDLYDKLVADSRNASYNKIQTAMNFVKDNHTYVNRVDALFSIL
jgi:hypothetical protein